MAIRQDIYTRMKEKYGLYKNHSEELLEQFLDVFTELLEEDGVLKINEFGVFKITESKERMGKNPKTSEKIVIPAKKNIKFKPSTKYKAKLNKEK